MGQEVFVRMVLSKLSVKSLDDTLSLSLSAWSFFARNTTTTTATNTTTNSTTITTTTTTSMLPQFWREKVVVTSFLSIPPSFSYCY